jgi:hypothetical protein
LEKLQHKGGKFMSVKYHQTTFSEIFGECRDMFHESSPSFFKLLEEYIDLNEFIPYGFYADFHKSLGRNRTYPLTGFLSALILQKILSIPTDALLITLLNLCKEMRCFCGFDKVPDAPLFTRFKQNFVPHIEMMFHNMVDYTEPICQAIDANLANILAFDTSGVELYVTENNPKTVNSLIKKLKAYYKNNPDIDPYKMAYGLMPTESASCSDAKQQYINGHFCYADKFAIITNGLGIIRHIAFLDATFKKNHPELLIHEKSDSPNTDKLIGDSTSLKHVLADFFTLHPSFKFTTFLGDSAFDSFNTYGFLKNDFHFTKVVIPYNSRNESSLLNVGYNIFGYPTCPNDNNIAMKYHGICREKGRSDRIKWGCPKMQVVKGQWLCDCNNPCSTAKHGRTSYTNGNMDFRMFPGLQRDSDEWISLYKVRTIVERAISHIKINMCVAGRKSRNHLTTKADVYIAAIANQFTVVVPHRLNKPQYIRSLKPLVA